MVMRQYQAHLRCDMVLSPSSESSRSSVAERCDSGGLAGTVEARAGQAGETDLLIPGCECDTGGHDNVRTSNAARKLVRPIY